MKKYRVTVSFAGDRYVNVSANNERQAKQKAQARVRKMKIGSDVRKDWTDVDEY